jgi:peptide/nickel transport system permease protein
MLRYSIKRLVHAAFTLVVFQTVLFLLFQALPLDHANLIRASEAYRQGIRQALGLDLPIWKQYFKWMGHFFTGDLGRSYAQRSFTVSGLFYDRIPRTLLLFLPGTLLGFSLGLALGKTIAWHRGGWVETSLTVAGTFFYTSFGPWLGFVLINIFALWLRLAPPENMISARFWAGQPLTPEIVIWWMLLGFVVIVILSYAINKLAQDHNPIKQWIIRLFGLAGLAGAMVVIWMISGMGRLAADILYHLLLPLLTLILLSFGETMLLMRTTMIDVLSDDHVLAARAKGLTSQSIRDRHVARIAILPVLARFIIQLPLIIIGSFILEKIFFWHGMGELLFNAVETFDLPVVLGTLSMVGIVMLMAHLILDILVAWLDPRTRKMSTV